jgi:hypothetical protein
MRFYEDTFVNSKGVNDGAHRVRRKNINISLNGERMNKNTLLSAISYVCCILALSLCLTFTSGSAAEDKIGDVNSIIATVIDETVRPGDPNVDEGETRCQSHFPENPELYIPMPIPEKIEPEVKTQYENRIVSYNMLTGEEVVGGTTEQNIPSMLLRAGSRGARAKSSLEFQEQEIQPLNFTDLSRVTNPAAYPWSANVKLFITFAPEEYPLWVRAP